MLDGLAVRITLPFSDASGIVREWAMKAEKLLCYEHVGEATKKPHVHMLLINVGCHKERLKQLAKPWVPIGSSGNEFWSFKAKTAALGPITEETSRKYVIYMTKGQFEPSYVKGYDLEWLNACKASWMVKEEEDSRETKLYASFEDYIYSYWLEDHDRDTEFKPGTTVFHVDKASVVQRLARAWSFSINKQLWTVRTATDAKMVFLTYCIRFGLTIPESVKLW